MLQEKCYRHISVTKESRMRKPFADREYEKRVITECALSLVM